MKIYELREKSKEDLAEMLNEKRGRVEVLREAIRTRKIKNVRELSAVKKDIARILTVIRLRKHE